MYKNLGYKVYTTTFKNHIQKFLMLQLVKTNQLLSKTEQYYTNFRLLEM